MKQDRMDTFYKMLIFINHYDEINEMIIFVTNKFVINYSKPTKP